MLKKRFLNQSGMTLVETMVAASLLAGLAVAGMTLFKNQSAGQKTIEANYEITNLFQQIRVVLSDQGNCTSSFVGQSFTAGNPTAIIKDVSGTPTTLYQINTPISGTLVKITSYRIERSPLPLAGNETWLKINFSKGRGTLLENTTKMMKLVYTPTGGNIQTCYAYNNSTDSYWLQSAPPDIYFTAGNVGIGTSTPAQKLDVVGAGSFRIAGTFPTATDGLGTYLDFDTSTNTSRIVSSNPSDAGMAFFTKPGVGSAPTERMRITGNGDVGIGTTAPNASLQVVGGVRARGGPPGGNGVNNNGYAFAGSGDNDSGMFSTADGVLEFYSNSFEVMRLQSGNVGIGTTTPAQRLQVQGNTSTSGETYTGGWFRSTSSNAGWYHEVHGGGWFMSDNDWIRSYGGKNIYHDTGIMRTDGTLQVGGSGATFNVGNGGNLSYLTNVLFANTSGNVGIGSTGPVAKLHIESPAGGTAALYINGQSGQTWLPFTDGRNYIRGATQVDGNLTVNGAGGIVSPNGFWYASDRRLKTNIEDLPSGLEKVLQMRPRNFTWKKSNKKDTGFIAQELQSIDPKLVQAQDNKEKTLTLKLEGLFPYIVKAIQELYEMITGTQDAQVKLSREVAELKKENSDLKARLDRQDEILKRIEERANKNL